MTGTTVDHYEGLHNDFLPYVFCFTNFRLQFACPFLSFFCHLRRSFGLQSRESSRLQWPNESGRCCNEEIFLQKPQKLRHWTFEFWKERQRGGLGIRKILGSPKQCQLHLMGSMMIRLFAQQISFAVVLSINDAGKTRRSNSQRSVLQKVMHRWSWWQLMWYTMGRNSTLMDDPLRKITNDAHIS